MANNLRSYIRTAYTFDMKLEHDYRTTSPRRYSLV